jgi:hypothetical protein
MDSSTLDIILIAPLASIFGVILFWFLQLLFIESQKYFLEKIRLKHEVFCRFTNFLGVFFQSICHALGYTVTKSGVSDFYISVNYGRVAPKKEKKGIFEWVANLFLFMGPFFIPAFLILICLFFLINIEFNFSIASNIVNYKYSFGGQLVLFGSSLNNFSVNFLQFLLNIDFFHPSHFGFILLMIVLGLGIRPSRVGETKVDRVNMIYDLKNIWNLIRNKPIYLFLFFILSYLFYYFSVLSGRNWYTILFSFFGWLSIISIISIVITHLIIFFIISIDKIDGGKKLIPYIIIPSSYILMRIFLYYFPNDYKYLISNVVMISTGIFSVKLLKKNGTNNFKANTIIKFLRRNNKGAKDE